MTSTSYIDLTIDNFDVQLPHEGQEKHGVDDDISQPNSKRAKVEHGTESVAAAEEAENGLDDVDNDEDAEDNCSICLHRVEDRTVIPNCSHEFCFECLLVWIGLRFLSKDVGRHWIMFANGQHGNAIYEHDLYAKHVGSNKYTKYRPYPTPSQFAASADLIARTTTFLRRELRVWEGLDVEFLTNLIISLMKSIDIRSESAVKLLAEFLDMGSPEAAKGKHVNSEHFAHEVYCYVRSPYKDLFVYDTIVQASPFKLP
ncbi:hypothetical protein D9611_010380 [Ephemerocybe angulata]|uniref:RING-type E3 ubiquitin transferase n=1 Tax=Ephemerocybe angulata TaxID=980116 RepID=A0A8H5BB36_9AGAR|nr:hypothetical protein D9611_010380 [Tulosesus angulatus]